MSEQGPGGAAHVVGLAIAAAEQVAEALIGQLLDRRFGGKRIDLVGQVASLDNRVVEDPERPGWRDEAPANIAEQIAVGLVLHGR
jgi:hypothetical protein